MKQTVEFEDTCKVDDVPVSAILKVQRSNRYGSVLGLEDSELANPDELEQQVIRQEWEPILLLPVQGRKSGFYPGVDESGSVDWGAFGTVDFDRHRPDYNKARYKVEKLKEQLKDVMILLSIVGERLPSRAKYLVVKFLRTGIIQMDHIENTDMESFVRLYQRARNLHRQIWQVNEASRRRQAQQQQAWLEVV